MDCVKHETLPPTLFFQRGHHSFWGRLGWIIFFSVGITIHVLIKLFFPNHGCVLLELFPCSFDNNPILHSDVLFFPSLGIVKASDIDLICNNSLNELFNQDVVRVPHFIWWRQGYAVGTLDSSLKTNTLSSYMTLKNWTSII